MEAQPTPFPTTRRVIVYPPETPTATPIPTLAAKSSVPSRFQPGEREYVHSLVKEVMAHTITGMGEEPPTDE